MKQLRLIAATVFLSLPMMAGAKPVSPSEKRLSPDLNSEALLVELTGKDLSKESDISLYAEMISAYHEGDEIGFKSRLQNLLRRFPQSSYADNALFVAGRMAVDRGNYAEAIKYFAQIERQYPRSNKVVAAKFAKAMTYKKMNLPEFSRKTLSEVRSKYPGSPESFRADVELKIFK